MRMCCSGCSAALQLQRALYVLASWTAIRCFAAGADIGDYNVCKLLLTVVVQSLAACYVYAEPAGC
jgi:hypothetical protein